MKDHFSAGTASLRSGEGALCHSERPLRFKPQMSVRLLWPRTNQQPSRRVQGLCLAYVSVWDRSRKQDLRCTRWMRACLGAPRQVRHGVSASPLVDCWDWDVLRSVNVADKTINGNQALQKFALTLKLFSRRRRISGVRSSKCCDWGDVVCSMPNSDVERSDVFQIFRMPTRSQTDSSQARLEEEQ